MKHVHIQNADMAWHIAASIQFPPAIISVHPY